jgi:hypothetical protein
LIPLTVFSHCETSILSKMDFAASETSIGNCLPITTSRSEILLRWRTGETT